MKTVALSCRIMKTCERQYYNLNIVCFIILISDASVFEYETFHCIDIYVWYYLYLTEARVPIPTKELGPKTLYSFNNL